ncbi:MAG: tetratricopeptide repeat protein [Bacteroidota bacterium]
MGSDSVSRFSIIGARFTDSVTFIGSGKKRMVHNSVAVDLMKEISKVNFFIRAESLKVSHLVHVRKKADSCSAALDGIVNTYQKTRSPKLRRELQRRYLNSVNTMEISYRYHRTLISNFTHRPSDRQYVQNLLSCYAVEKYDTLVLSELAGMYRTQEQYDSSLYFFEQCLSVAPNNYHYVWENGITSIMAHRYNNAVSYFIRMKELRPDLAESWEKLGTSYTYLKDYPSAKDCFSKALSLDSTHQNSYINYFSVLFREKEYLSALTLLSKAPEKVMRSQVYGLRKAGVLQKLGRVDESLGIYSTIISLSPYCYEAYVGLGEILADRQMNDSAISLFQKAISIDSTRPHAYFNLGKVYFRLQQKEMAEQCYHRSISVDSSMPCSYYRLAVVHTDRGESSTAVKFIELAFQNGYDDMEEIESDPDLNALRKDESFRSLILKYKEKNYVR